MGVPFSPLDVKMPFVEVKVPQFPESVPEGILLNWRKRPGQEVELNEILVDIETDKFILEFPAPATGVLAEIIKNEGDHVSSEELIAIIDRRGGPGAPASAHEAKAAPVSPPPAR